MCEKETVNYPSGIMSKWMDICNKLMKWLKMNSPTKHMTILFLLIKTSQNMCWYEKEIKHITILFLLFDFSIKTNQNMHADKKSDAWKLKTCENIII